MQSFCVVAAIASLFVRVADAAQAYPLAQIYPQPDGTESPPLVLHGDHQYNWLSDEKGYHVIIDEDGWYVYAKKSEEGEMVSTGVRVGHKNPKKIGLKPYDTADQKKWLTSSLSDVDRSRRHLMTGEVMCNRLGSKDSPCRRKGLVVLVRFADHAHRVLPSSTHYDILFNNNGPDATVAPSGSIYDVFNANSYGSYIYQNDVTEWITVSQTEAEAAGGNMGLGTAEVMTTWREALSKLGEQGINIGDYDADDTGKLDSLVFIHSGAGAEKGGVDCKSQAPYTRRIWSYQHSGLGFTSNGVTADRYYVASGVTHTCPLDNQGNDAPYKDAWGIGRIGVIAHECGHFLGVEDLYDASLEAPGNGVGNFDMMGNLWGWYPQPATAQLYPPLMGAWTKKQLGWVRVQHINGNVQHFLLRSCTSDVVWEINHNMADGEYFLIEHRHPCSFDVELRHHDGWLKDRAGMAIWHIDENSGADMNKGGPPRVPGAEFPDHYKVAVVQGDGQFNLERHPPMEQGGLGNKGDMTDLFMNLWGWRTDKAFKIDDSGTTMCDGWTHSIEPNTKSYSTGIERPTGITILIPYNVYDVWVGVRVELTGAGDHQGAILPPS